MAEGDDNSEKTEAPSQRRLDQAHEKGDVAKSQEVGAFFTLMGVTLVVGMLAGPSSALLLPSLRGLLAHSGTLDLDGGTLRLLILSLGGAAGLALLLPVLVMMGMGLFGQLIQHRPVFSLEPLQPKLSKISPLAGLKRLFSLEAQANFLKGLLKIALVALSMMIVLWPHQTELAALLSLDLGALLPVIQSRALMMLGAMLAVMFLIAAADFLWVRFRWMQRQRMTIKELKEEFKQTEGDPTIKGKIRQLRLERSRRRMMAAVPSATVVITNPTHYAVALKYEMGMQAPVCVAKGVDNLALTLRKIAEEHGVSVVENPPLARILYASLAEGQAIPEEHYKAVAEVIGYVLNIKRRKTWRN